MSDLIDRLRKKAAWYGDTDGGPIMREAADALEAHGGSERAIKAQAAREMSRFLGDAHLKDDDKYVTLGEVRRWLLEVARAYEGKERYREQDVDRQE